MDKQQNNTNSNNMDNGRHHTAAEQYGTQATIVSTPNPFTTTHFARGKRSNDGYQPRPARCAADVLISFYTPSKVHRSEREWWFFSRLTTSTHRSSTICPLMNKSFSSGGKHPCLIPSSLIFLQSSVAKGRIASSYARSCEEGVTTRWLGHHLRPTAVRVQCCSK